MARIDWIDATRGIGIVLVVAGHVARGLIAAGIARGPAWAWMDYGVYTFHMPVFFLLAGLNVPGSLARCGRRFLRAKLWTLAYPYLLWSLIQGSVLVALSPMTNTKAHLGDLLAIGWRPMAQFWFLYALMLCQLAACAIGTRPRLLAAAAAVAFALVAAMPQGGLAEEFLHAFPYFAAGILLSERGHRWAAPVRTTGADALRATLAAVGLTVAIPASGLLDRMDFDAAAALPAAVCGIVLLVSLARLLHGRALDIACGLGRMSMTIYVLHILAASAARLTLVRLHATPDPWIYLVACSFIGLAASVACHVVFERLDLLTPLGLGEPPRPRRLQVA